MKPVRRSETAQAQTEYLIVLAFTVIVLVLASMDPSPMQALIDALRGAFSAFSYAISFSV